MVDVSTAIIHSTEKKSKAVLVLLRDCVLAFQILFSRDTESFWLADQCNMNKLNIYIAKLFIKKWDKMCLLNLGTETYN